MLATITNLSPSVFSTTLAALQSRAVVLVTFEKKTAAQSSGALLSQAVLSPIEVYVELSWLERVVNFAVETIQLTEGTTTQEVDIETPEGKELDPFYTEPITLTAREVQEMADPKARLLSLAHLLEKDYMVDWAVTLKGVTLSVVEVHEAQSSKLVVRDVHVKNDIQRKLKRSERLLNQNNNNAAERFGSVEDDWVNYVLIDMEVSAFCQYVPLVAADGKAVWQPLLEPTPLEIVAKKNLFARRQPQYAALSVEVSIPQTLKLNLSRSRLSVFCFSFSLITDFMQSVSRRMMVHKGQTGTTAGPNSSTKLFEVELLEMDARYTQDHYNEVSKSEVYYASFSPTSIQCTTAKKRFVEVKNGLLTVFHACRPTYPHTIYELVKGHYHIVDGEHNTIDIFMENGGLDHFTARKDYLASRRLFEETLQFPMFDGNFVLFKRFVENWINEHKNQMSDVPVEEVEKALLCMENASHTVPASHITVRCKDSAELGQLKSGLERERL
ncbi:hypothetical protein AGDE_15197 [Angomonas deanei]|uniref:Uncharacterized protein n=1 Tax=Angomonas deanei TaxID=59799 RepID=A0A7G2CCH3_9TRYP|nr:hypothetical protein AGDE_15197 [Angomonas deanei]CAD2215782.1 hypothetical protein, conserved [Angomonas deanei]|eukprot:EPY19542.1 hypothetical protein AGDE_15197 [Angomonas deanei]